MKAIIIEDSRLARQELKELLKKHKEIEVIDEAVNTGEAIDKINELNPQVIFLDINLGDGSGFDVLEQIDNMPAVIFTTAYDEFAIQAFEVNALDYLMKPINPKKLKLAIDKVPPIEHVNEPLLKEESKIFVKDGERCWLIEIGRIRQFRSAGNYAQIYFDENKPMIYKSLSKIEERLPKDLFFRANRQMIVNLNYIKHVEAMGNSGLLLTMIDGKEVDVSRRHTSNFKQLLSL
ncbi:MAG: LytTR family DNA-binding domain-containing protein [Kangiellaceae bacterium]|nr:LytTR family DNA-binding domain-containing protein [Kangiellaceae bacterium]MCW9000007.1 LytTR family DNA-binding domain-containing protein [Kangiellaceae bacterium]